MSNVAIITGGSSGLGLALARHIGKNGYLPIILARRPEGIDQALQELKQDGVHAEGFSADVTDEGALRRVYEHVKDTYGAVDFLVCNAGRVSVKLLADYENSSELKRDVEVDLWGTMLSTYVFLPLVHDGGKILMISSGYGLMGPAGYTAYAAAKAGIINFAECLRRELHGRRISVHVAVPGDMDTPQLHEEHAATPEWMHREAPTGMMAPDRAARIILHKSRGNRLLVVPHFEVAMLVWLGKILPRIWRDAVIDRMFPRP